MGAGNGRNVASATLNSGDGNASGRAKPSIRKMELITTSSITGISSRPNVAPALFLQLHQPDDT
jgi:hypothetical protein